MKEIALTQDYKAIVDDEDFDAINQYKWRAVVSSSGVPYAARTQSVRGKEITVLMHRMVLGCNHKDGQIVDHKNGNGLDNRKENLRLCSYSENARNAKKSQKKRTSKYKGVYFCQKEGIWRAQIKANRKLRALGRFKSEQDAALAYNRAAQELHGDFASLNVVK